MESLFRGVKILRDTGICPSRINYFWFSPERFLIKHGVALSSQQILGKSMFTILLLLINISID